MCGEANVCTYNVYTYMNNNNNICIYIQNKYSLLAIPYWPYILIILPLLLALLGVNSYCFCLGLTSAFWRCMGLATQKCHSEHRYVRKTGCTHHKSTNRLAKVCSPHVHIYMFTIYTYSPYIYVYLADISSAHTLTSK